MAIDNYGYNYNDNTWDDNTWGSNSEDWYIDDIEIARRQQQVIDKIQARKVITTDRTVTSSGATWGTAATIPITKISIDVGPGLFVTKTNDSQFTIEIDYETREKLEEARQATLRLNELEYELAHAFELIEELKRMLDPLGVSK